MVHCSQPFCVESNGFDPYLSTSLQFGRYPVQPSSISDYHVQQSRNKMMAFATATSIGEQRSRRKPFEVKQVFFCTQPLTRCDFVLAYTMSMMQAVNAVLRFTSFSKRGVRKRQKCCTRRWHGSQHKKAIRQQRTRPAARSALRKASHPISCFIVCLNKRASAVSEESSQKKAILFGRFSECRQRYLAPRKL